MATRSGARWRQIDSDNDSEFDGDELLSAEVSDSESDDEHPVLPTRNNGEFHFVVPGDDFRENELPFFYGTPGINPIKEIPTETDDEKVSAFLHVFFSDDFFRTLASWTNKRAQRHFSDHIDELSSREKRWSDVTGEEMKKFFGIIFLMGVIQKPKISDYWSTDPTIATPFFFEQVSLSRDRFQILLRFMRFADYDEIDANDRLSKVRPFLNMVRDIARNSYLPEATISIDESLLLWKGRLFFRQYIPKKRSRFGIKFYLACESASGYMWSIEMHCDRNEHNRFAASVAPQLSMSERIVVHLIEPLLNLGYTLVVDNWFNSVRLAQFLLLKATLLRGTIRTNRGVPAQLSVRRLDVHQSAFMRNGDVLISRFVDRKQSGIKNVYLLDSGATAQTADITRVRRNGIEETIAKPTTIGAYNQTMGAVDRNDAILETCNASRKSYRWFVKVGVYLSQRLLLNAFILYRKSGGSLENFSEFSIAAAKHFICETGVGRHRPPRQRIVQATLEAHVPNKFPIKNNKRQARKCKRCSRPERRRETVFFCPACPGQPAVCLECFPFWHSS